MDNWIQGEDIWYNLFPEQQAAITQWCINRVGVVLPINRLQKSGYTAKEFPNYISFNIGLDHRCKWKIQLIDTKKPVEFTEDSFITQKYWNGVLKPILKIVWEDVKDGVV